MRAWGFQQEALACRGRLQVHDSMINAVAFTPNQPTFHQKIDEVAGRRLMQRHPGR